MNLNKENKKLYLTFYIYVMKKHKIQGMVCQIQ